MYVTEIVRLSSNAEPCTAEVLTCKSSDDREALSPAGSGGSDSHPCTTPADGERTYVRNVATTTCTQTHRLVE